MLFELLSVSESTTAPESPVEPSGKVSVAQFGWPPLVVADEAKVVSGVGSMVTHDGSEFRALLSIAAPLTGLLALMFANQNPALPRFNPASL